MSTDQNSTRGYGWQIRSLGRPLARLASHVQEEWRHRRTEKLLESLPADIRKDIGWPAWDAKTNRVERLH